MTDLLASVLTMEKRRGKRPDIKEEIIAQATNLRYMGYQITIGWIPAHRGVTGNEQVYITAKSGVDRGEKIYTGLGKLEGK